MAQVAMQQAIKEITDYLATISEKVDDVLRAQKDAVLAQLIGVGFVLDEAMIIREHGGRVNEVTWSKVQGASATIAETQAYALRQLDALAEKLERKTKIGDLATTIKQAEPMVGEWLAVLARCFRLQEAIAVLELDRVLDAAPDDLDGHRLGLKAARQKRLDTISRSTERLMARMDAAAGTANTKVLLHPKDSPAVVHSGQHVASAVSDFHGRLGIQSGRQLLEAKRWADAAASAWDKVLATGAEGIDASRRRSNETLDRAKSVTGKLTGGIVERGAPTARGQGGTRRGRLKSSRPSARLPGWPESVDLSGMPRRAQTQAILAHSAATSSEAQCSRSAPLQSCAPGRTRLFLRGPECCCSAPQRTHLAGGWRVIASCRLEFRCLRGVERGRPQFLQDVGGRAGPLTRREMAASRDDGGGHLAAIVAPAMLVEGRLDAACRR